MFTVEFKINGSPIAILYGRNVNNKGPIHKYIYELYRPEEDLVKGEVEHVRSEGIEKLTQLILEDIG